MSEIPHDKPWLDPDLALMLPAVIPTGMFDMLEMITELRCELMSEMAEDSGNDYTGWTTRRIAAMRAYIRQLEVDFEVKCGWKCKE